MKETVKVVKKKSGKFLGEFKEFALRGNVVDLAIGVVIGTALSSVTSSLVKDIIMPPLGMLLNDVDFSDMFISLNGQHYQSLAAARAAGAATVNYGAFINVLINFLVISLVIFLVVKQVNQLRRLVQTGEVKTPTEKPCRYCHLSIPIVATRCPHCTSQL